MYNASRAAVMVANSLVACPFGKQKKLYNAEVLEKNDFELVVLFDDIGTIQTECPHKFD